VKGREGEVEGRLVRTSIRNTGMLEISYLKPQLVTIINYVMRVRRARAEVMRMAAMSLLMIWWK